MGMEWEGRRLGHLAQFPTHGYLRFLMFFLPPLGLLQIQTSLELTALLLHRCVRRPKDR